MVQQMRINGKVEAVAVRNIAELLAARGIDPGAKYLAIAVNGSVVPRSQWSSAILDHADEIEIVRPREGG